MMAKAATVTNVVSSLRFLFADFIGDTGGEPPALSQVFKPM